MTTSEQPFLTDVKELRSRARASLDKGAVTPAYLGDVKQAIEILQTVLATEIVCVLRYTMNAIAATGISSDSVKEEFEEHAKEEQGHARAVAERINQLGGIPNFNPEGLASRSASQYSEGGNLVEMIKENLIAERIACEHYRELIRYFGDKDPTTRVMMEGILTNEEEHATTCMTCSLRTKASPCCRPIKNGFLPPMAEKVLLRAHAARTAGTILQRPFGKNASVKISALGFGGHHLGQAEDQPTAVRLVAEAIDGGITFFDNCWEYHRGKSEDWMGAGLKGKRDRIFLMTKVCTHGRDKALAMKMLEQSLHRLQTDHLDLWQIHGVTFDNDPNLFIRPNGAAEALEQAKKQGKVRFTGFTGHKDPGIHLKMIQTGFPFDSVQMPINAFDATFRSFQTQVVPEATKRGMAVLGMKPIGGAGDPVKKGVLTAEEALRYAMSVPGVTVTITGMEKPEILRQNLRIAQNFTPMQPAEMQALAARVGGVASDGRYELFKVSLKYDNPEARLAHDFPLDMQSVEVKEMVAMTKNTGHPFPDVGAK